MHTAGRQPGRGRSLSPAISAGLSLPGWSKPRVPVASFAELTLGLRSTPIRITTIPSGSSSICISSNVVKVSVPRWCPKGLGATGLYTACRVLGVGWGAAVLFCGSGQAAVCGGMSWKLQLIFLQVGELLGSACRSVSLD